jgi:hypothetical protein
MVHVDKLPALKRLVAHAAGVLLGVQQAVELLLSEPIASLRLSPGNGSSLIV